MRCVLDTNILISGLISADGPPGRLLDAWIAGQFMLVSSEAQLREFRRASRYERVKPYIAASEAGALVNAIRATDVLIDRLPVI
jgi:putative PIN family toxin of toxin-antitoxin system